MNIKELLNDWAAHSCSTEETADIYIKLPFEKMAGILALVDMFPGRTREQIIIDLLGLALNEIEEEFPYIKGDRIITEDEFGDPVYEDVGLTPRFLELTKSHLKGLKSKHK